MASTNEWCLTKCGSQHRPTGLRHTIEAHVDTAEQLEPACMNGGRIAGSSGAEGGGAVDAAKSGGGGKPMKSDRVAAKWGLAHHIRGGGCQDVGDHCPSGVQAVAEQFAHAADPSTVFLRPANSAAAPLSSTNFSNYSHENVISLCFN